MKANTILYQLDSNKLFGVGQLEFHHSGACWLKLLRYFSFEETYNLSFSLELEMDSDLKQDKNGDNNSDSGEK